MTTNKGRSATEDDGLDDDDDVLSWENFDPEAVGIIGFDIGGDPIWGWGNSD